MSRNSSQLHTSDSAVLGAFGVLRQEDVKTVKKKGRPPKDHNLLNAGSIGSSHTVAGNSSSKTVAFILKQNDPKDSTKVLHQSQKKKSKQEHASQSSNVMNQFVKSSNNSPLGHVGSPSIVVSPAMSPSSIRGVSPLGKEHNHPATTKSSSLSRDLSPSRITAQMVKVMAETVPTASTTPNLLRSALQGNMPDPMGILSSSKTEGGLVSITTSTGGSISTFNPSRRSPANVSNFNQSSNSVSGSSHKFSKILTSMAGAGGYLGQQSLDPSEAKLRCSPISNTLSKVENLLASSDGTIQTVNVNHVPKLSNPGTTNMGSASGTSSLSSSPRPSPRSAMEVAQQIKMEANGQKSSAQLAALRPGMQQQLRTQIQSSRSIDAQLAPKQAQLPIHKPSTKDVEQKTSMDVSMPLLAAKLAPAAVPSVVKVTPSSASPFNQQTAGNLLTSLSAAVTSSASTSPASSLSRKSAQYSTSPKSSSSELKRYQQQTSSQKHVPQHANTSFGQSNQESTSSADHAWLLHQQHPQLADSLSSGLGLGLGNMITELEKQQTLERMLQASICGPLNERTAQTETPDTAEGHAQTLVKHLTSPHAQQRANAMPHTTSGQGNVNKMAQDIVNQTTMGGGCLKFVQNHHSSITAPTTHQNISKYRLGDSKLTAIDVDMDIGQLASITSDASAPKAEVTVSSAGADVRRTHLTALSQQLFNTSVSPSTPASSAKSKDSPAFLPVKSTSSFSFHSSPTSSLAQIPKPIMHPTSSPSHSSSRTALPPPPDYTPPPPYPVKLAQQFHQGEHHQQQPSVSNKTGQAAKHTIQNPFTFPTSGIKVIADHNAQGMLSYKLATDHKHSGSNTENIPSNTQGLLGNFREPMPSVAGKSQVDVSSIKPKVGVQHPTDVSKLYSDSLEANTNFQSINHINEEERKLKLQPFNQRISNLSCFPVMNSSYRAAYRSHVMAVQRARSGVTTSTTKSLDILRQNLQRSINKELTEIIKKYADKYFQPALDNIKQNNNEPFLGDEHINYVCRQILEEAKSEFISDTERRSVTPSDIPDNVSESGSLGGRKVHNFIKRSRISDSDSEKGSDPGGFKRKIAKKKGKPLYHGGSGRVTPSKPYKTGETIKREGPKWDPERMKPDTLFVMGARANKALGLGNTRGRLYIRHPDIFKYIGDQEDKLWLFEHNLMPATGGKAYMLLLEDIEDLSRSDEYKDSPGLMMHECVGFTAPEWMLVKMKEQMNALRSDSNKRSLSHSPVSEMGEPRPKILPFSAFSDTNIKEETIVSPADTEDMEFLSTAENEDTQRSSGISPFTVTAGFDEGVSPSPSDLDPIEDTAPVSSLFT